MDIKNFEFHFQKEKTFLRNLRNAISHLLKSATMKIMFQVSLTSPDTFLRRIFLFCFPWKSSVFILGLHVSPKKEIESQLAPKIIKNSSPARAREAFSLFNYVSDGVSFFVEGKKVVAESRKIAFGNSGKSIITNKKNSLYFLKFVYGFSSLLN